MRYWLIAGEQQDGEHEYSIKSMRKFKKEPSVYECTEALVQDHAFGLEEDEDFDPMDEHFNYGDGMTRIRYCGLRELNKQEFDTLAKIHVWY